MTRVLAAASDEALTKLAQPGVFQADQAGITSGLSKSIDDAAGLAANEVKPVFRSAIKRMTIKRGIDVLSSGIVGTEYLRQTRAPTFA